MRSTLKLGIAALAALVSAGAARAEDLPKTQLSVIGSTDQSVMHKTIERPFWTDYVPKASKGAIKPSNAMLSKLKGLQGGGR